MAIEKENPYKDNNPYDVVQELRVIVEDLKRAVYGDPASRSPGMFQEFDSLRRDVNLLRQELEQVKSRKPSAANWTIGYISFCAGGIFAVIAVLTQRDSKHPRRTCSDICDCVGGNRSLLFSLRLWLDRGQSWISLRAHGTASPQEAERLFLLRSLPQ
jgi:hypothetical protein